MLFLPPTAIGPPTAMAQEASTGLRKEFDLIYQRLLADPSDRALNRRMIEVALQLKDYDAAIGAVERLVFYEPGNAGLQIEAARLYLRIESYAAARGYLKDVLAMPALSANDRKEAETLLARIDDETNPSIWDLFVQSGVRYQSNANIGPTSLGSDVQFPAEEPTPDWNDFALGTLALNAPVGKNAVIEGSVSAYYADQFKVDRLDLGFAEITGGPRFMTDDGKLSVKPYGLAQGILLGGSPYQFAYGGGALVRLTFADGWWLEPQFEYKNRNFYNSDNYPMATDQTGDLYTYAVNGNGRLSERLSVTSRMAFNQDQAVTDYQSYDQYMANLSVRLDFDIFAWKNWSISPFAGVGITQYKGVAPPEAAVPGLDTIRHDFQWSVGANLEIPLLKNTGLGVQVQYTENESNLDRFTYENLQVLLGPLARF